MGFHAAQGAGSGRAFGAKMVAPGRKDFVHKSLRSQRQAIGKVAHPAAQHLPVVEPAFRGKDRVHFLRFEPAPQRASFLVQTGFFAPAKVFLINALSLYPLWPVPLSSGRLADANLHASSFPNSETV